jgi:hypothetical protein
MHHHRRLAGIVEEWNRLVLPALDDVELQHLLLQAQAFQAGKRLLMLFIGP